MAKNAVGGKPQSRLSFREFMLLIVLGIILVGYLLGYQLVYPKWMEFQDLKMSNDIRELGVNRLEADFKNKAAFEKQLSDLSDSVEVLRAELPAYRAQEELLLTADDAAAQTSLIINVMTFDAPTVVLDGSTTSGAAVQAGAEGTEAGQTGDAVETGFLVVDQQVSISFQGSYASVYAFLQTMEKSVRKVFPKDLSLSANEEGLLAGTMKLSFLSYVDASNEATYQFDLQMTPGRMDPFTPYPGYDNGATKPAAAVEAFALPDFSVKINNYQDNAAKVILDAVNDSTGSIAADENKSMTARLVVKGDGKTVTHSWTIGGNTVSAAKSRTVANGQIMVQVISQPRKDAKDLVGLTLDVDNQSGVPVVVRVAKDDIQNPRFRLGATNGTVTLTR